MDTFGLQDWEFRFSGSKEFGGRCSPTKELIQLSGAVTDINSRETIINIMLHEVAHALQYLKDGIMGHDDEWEDICRLIGGTPYAIGGFEPVHTPWVMVCPECHRGQARHQRLKRPRLCNHCYADHKYSVMEWITSEEAISRYPDPMDAPDILFPLDQRIVVLDL